MKGRTFIGLVFVVAALGMAIPAGVVRADVFNMGGTRDANGIWTGLASLETVHVGNAGNMADTRYDANGFGSVSYEYNIGKYEVTAGQYTEFLNKVAATDAYGLYNTNMWSSSYGCKIERYAGSGTVGDPYQYRVAADWANRPVNYVSWGDSARFANWLHNIQPTGAQSLLTTEDGAYYLNGATSDAQLLAVNREADWNWAVTSEDEWYKAAYYKGGSTNACYWDYPTESNTTPSNAGSDGYTDPGNHANFLTDVYTIGSPYWRTNVGEFENSASAYGTFDQGGNIWEWNEAILSVSRRGVRAGSFYGYTATSLLASFRDYGGSPTNEYLNVGFRISEVPEPASMALLALGGLVILRRRSGR